MARNNSAKSTESTESTESTANKNLDNMNTQTFETSTTVQFPEQNFTRSFEPLTSRKDGKAQLTFAGYKHSVSKDGNRAFLKIVFSVLDVTQQQPANISVLSNYKFSEDNTLGRLLKLMGYDHQKDVVVTDEDDEFGYSISEDLNQIYNFLDQKKGLIYKGFCKSQENYKGEYWYRIDVSSVEALIDKSGEQKRAYDASEGMSSEELNIDIEADGGDEK
ncbi:hypothetical protein [Nostoc sp.]